MQLMDLKNDLTSIEMIENVKRLYKYLSVTAQVGHANPGPLDPLCYMFYFFAFFSKPDLN